MAFTLDTYIRQVRNRHPAFEKRLVPDKVLADFVSLDQRDVLTMALLRDRQYLAQSLPIAFDLTNADLDAPGTAGIGTQGGVPAESDGQGGYRYVQETAGSAVEVETSGVVVLVDDTPVANATANTLTGTGVSWTTNVYQGDTVIIVAGLGANQAPRTIASNTSNQLTVTDNWLIQPDATSVFQVVQSVDIVDQTFGVVTDVPNVSNASGYLVRLNAQGVPYIDTTKPLTVALSRGVPLPPYQSVLSGTVRLTRAATNPDVLIAPLTLVAYADRFRPSGDFNAYLLNGMLYLIGNRVDWTNVQGIELSYTPILPDLTAKTDYFLLPDTTLPMLVARGATFAASRLQGLPDIPAIAMDGFLSLEDSATKAFLGTLNLTRTSRVSRMRRGRF